MRDYLGLINKALTITLATMAVSAAADEKSSPFKVTVECVGNRDCRFNGSDMPVMVRILNVSREEVFLTADYMQDAGPYSTFRDVRTGKVWHGHRRLGTDELLGKYTAIKPGATVKLDYILDRSDIRFFAKRGGSIDVIVQLEYSGYWLGANGKLAEYDDKAIIRISDAGGSAIVD